MIVITSTHELNSTIKNNPIVLLYFSHIKCNICKSLLPKIEKLVKASFPKLILAVCNIENVPEAAAQSNIFTAPAIVIYTEGKESIRYTRNVALNTLSKSILRPYNLIFR